jgi:hypothetical protein
MHKRVNLLYLIFKDDQVKENEIDRVCSTNGREEECI